MPKITPVPPKVEIKTERQAKILQNAIEDLKVVAFDTETTSLDIYSGKVRIISFSLPKVEWKSSWGELEEFYGSTPYLGPDMGTRIVALADYPFMSEVYRSLEHCDIVAHNWKFDAHMMYRNYNVCPGKYGIVYDTQILDYLLDENSSHGLKECCDRYNLYPGMKPFKKLFSGPSKKEIQVGHLGAYEGMPVVDWALITRRDAILEYAATDAYATMLLKEFLEEELRHVQWIDPADNVEKTMLDYYLIYELPYLKAVWEMERNGAKVSIDVLKRYEAPLKEQIESSKQKFYQSIGRVINLNSPDQVSQALYSPPPQGLGLPVLAYTSGGKSGKRKPATDKHVLAQLAEKYPEVEPLQTYNNLKKLYNDYVIGLQSKIHPDGRVRSTFNVHGTVTGRLSSSGPNLQNIVSSETEIGRKYNIRAAFIADTGNLLIGADYSTLEIVITAQISQDTNLIDALLSGKDLHSYTASLMFGIPYEEIVEAKKEESPTEEQKKLVSYRKYAKSVTFGVLYGAGEHKIADTVGCDLDRASEIINMFYEAYPGILESKRYWTEFCRQHGFVTTLLGRRRRLPTIWSQNKGVASRAERQLFNTMIQGTAADLMRSYMPKLVSDERLKKYDAKLILQVHDEVVLEVKEEYAEQAKEVVEEILESALDFIKWVVPLKADAAIGKSWAETK